MKNENSIAILEFIKENPALSSKQIHDGLERNISYATVKRLLQKLTKEKALIAQGRGRATNYLISPDVNLLAPIDLEAYFIREVDEREINHGYSFSLITQVIANSSLFSSEELEHLNNLQESYKDNISKLSQFEYGKELERLAVDLSWKSSQIEGNTYSLLETERLLKEQETAEGKTKDEAIMLLNHKEAIDFIIENPDYLNPVSIARIEDIHSILIKELGISRNIRNHRVGISGTNYRPLDNEHQIREALEDMCEVINNKTNAFEKALLLLVLISYIQPFIDGNKRTAIIVSNAVLIHNLHCPLTFRSISSIDYKKAMLVFYEQNNISAFKKIFIDQFEFAVNSYF